MLLSLPELKYAPAVFAVKNDYQIMTVARSDLLLWVTVDGTDYYDHSNGIIRSSSRIHRVTVPVEALDRAREYTVNYRRIIDRAPYFTSTEPPVSETFPFYPVRSEGDIRIYHLADTHSQFQLPSQTGRYFEDEIDLLVLNGDIPDHSGDLRNFDLIFRLCDCITGGSHPCVFSRGNHDLRGNYAENFTEYTPTENGHSYYTFRLGRLWGFVMDCGEDKSDDHPEYGNTVACHQFRLEETRYLESMIRHAEEEYLAPGVEYRLIIVHSPFSYRLKPPFDIEQPLFLKWLDLLEKNIKPQAMLSGHLHDTIISLKGGPLDNFRQICPVIVASRAVRENGKMIDFVGGAITLSGNTMKIEFTNKDHKVLQAKTIELEA